jgi:hypothetical protein
MRPSLILIVLLVTGCASNPQPSSYSVNEDLLVSGFPGLPKDARLVAERLASCSHFAGEFSGDRSERDKEVATTMGELRCETIDQDVSAIRQKYSDNRAVQEALAAASQL